MKKTCFSKLNARVKYGVAGFITACLGLGLVACNGGGPGPAGMAASANVAYVANAASDKIATFSYDSNGNLSQIDSATVNTGSRPLAVVTDHKYKYAYIPNYISETVSIYSIDQKTGKLIPLPSSSAVPAGAKPQALAIDPQDRFVYVANYGNSNLDSSISMFKRNGDGTLSKIGDPISSQGAHASALAINPNGKFLYVTNDTDNTIATFAINQDGGALTPLNTPLKAQGKGQIALTIDDKGQYAYVVNYGSGGLDGVAVYKIDQSSGLLSFVANSLTEKNPRGIVILPGDKFAYVTNNYSGNISQYSIQADGSLKYLSNSSVATGKKGLWGISCDPHGKFVYATNYDNHKIYMYSVGNDGQLAPLAKVAVDSGGNNPFGITPIKLH